MIDSNFRKLSPSMLRVLTILSEPGGTLIPGVLADSGCILRSDRLGSTIIVRLSTLTALDRRGLVVRRSRRARVQVYRLSAYGRSVLLAHMTREHQELGI